MVVSVSPAVQPVPAAWMALMVAPLTTVPVTLVRRTVTSTASRAALPEVVAPWLLARTAPRLPPVWAAGSASAQSPAHTW